jgi:Mu-like prophage major head subunit gpT
MNTGTQQDIMREICSIVEGQQIDPVGHAVLVTVIRGGKSANGYLYGEEVLGEIARMVEGAHAYADHGDDSTVTRSMRDLVGFYTDARYRAPGVGEAHGRVDATLHILEAADWLWSMIREACQLGRSDLIGLSIDIFGHWQPDDANNAKAVTRIIALNSCDVVTRPSAGGTFNRILHTVGTTDREGGSSMDPTIGTSPNIGTSPTVTTEVVDLASSSPTQVVHGPSMAAGAQSSTQVQESVTTQMLEPLQPHLLQELAHMQEQQRLIEAQRAEIERLLAQTRLDRAQALLEKKLQESILPVAVRSNVREKFAGRVFEEGELDREMNAALTMLAQLTRDGIVRGHGFEKAELTGSQITEAEKVQAAFDAMMGLAIDTSRLGNIKGFTSIREAYARVTGESSLLAGISSASQLGTIAIHESAPIVRISEADTTTASFSYLLGTSMNKRLLKDYQAWPAEWVKFCTIAPIRDFKQQTRVRLGAFGSLSIVAEDNAYTTVTLTDSSATYVPQKRGNLVQVSRETIINDDLQAVKQIPTKLAVAAAYTLAEFVYGFLSSNPAIYDGNNLFTIGAPHNNLGAAALSTVAMQTGITAMREQTNFAGKRLGLRPRFLVVPPELEFTSMVVTKSAGVPGSNNNDINPMLGYVTPIVAAQLTNTAQWFLVGDPREIDTIEIGFVGGQVNPTLFIQDLPLLGLNFTQDMISYKVRHEYGGAVVDYRGMYRGI